MVDWAYNDIDVYLSPSDNILGETSVNTNSWVPLSTYGLLRSRVALTPSTVEGTSISIPCRDGKAISTDSGRGNAKIEFEVLIADEWVHRASETTANMTLRERYDMVAALLNNTKRVAYKQPGRSANSYFIVYKTNLTFQDADEKVFIIKAQMEVHPFEFYFVGNIPTTIAVNATETFTNFLPLSECGPIYLVGNGAGSIKIKLNDSATWLEVKVAKAINESDAANKVAIDTTKNLVYTIKTKDNRNDYISGDLKLLRFKQGDTIYIQNKLAADLVVYPRNGIAR